ncbi:hypothetical protein V6N13_108884 [Hibiscus sabdariffa]|uniref:Uncharacterized protein n=1 Tax=Hibiscus sabdariffa TaxID=183260 RepID=A0ABR2FN76_9ROSI
MRASSTWKRMLDGNQLWKNSKGIATRANHCPRFVSTKQKVEEKGTSLEGNGRKVVLSNEQKQHLILSLAEPTILIGTMMASSNVANKKQNLYVYDLLGICRIVP